MIENFGENQPKGVQLENEVELSPAELREQVRPLLGEYLKAISASPLFREVLANIWIRSGDWQTVEIETENFHYFITQHHWDPNLGLTKHTLKDGKRVSDESVTFKIKDTDLGDSLQYSSAVQPVAENRDKIIILTRTPSAVKNIIAFLQRMKADLLTP